MIMMMKSLSSHLISLLLLLLLNLHNNLKVHGFSTSSRSSSYGTTTSGGETPPTPSTVTTNLIFPGGGIFFNWQGGVITYLRENNYDLSACAFSGSSAGALTATLAATNVDFEDATTLALELAASPNYNVWNRSLGLQGVLQPLIKEWLQTLVLPSTSQEQDEALVLEEINQNQRLSILLTPVPLLWTKEKKTQFTCREELIDANLASIYLPFFSNGGLWHTVNGKPYIDGNFLSNGKHYKPTTSTTPTSTQKNNKQSKKIKRSNTIFLNWKRDAVLSTKYRGEDDLVSTLQPHDIWDLVEQGKKYAATLEKKGRFRSIPKKNEK